MKKIILLLLAIITLQSCGTYQKISASDLSTTKIYENLNKSQSDLYVISNSWMIDAFNNADSVIQFSDKETGSIIGKYLVQGSIIRSGYLSTDTRIFAKIDISLKDNRAKISITPTDDIIVHSANATVNIKNSINNLVTSFESRITSKNTTVW